MIVMKTWPAGRHKKTEVGHLIDAGCDRLVLRQHTENGKSYEVQINFRHLDELVAVIAEIKRQAVARRFDGHRPGVPRGRVSP